MKIISYWKLGPVCYLSCSSHLTQTYIFPITQTGKLWFAQTIGCKPQLEVDSQTIVYRKTTVYTKYTLRALKQIIVHDKSKD